MFCLGTVYQWLWTNLSSIEWYWMSGTFHRMEENISRKMDFVKSYQHSNIFVGANNVQLILTYGRMFHGSINSNNVDSYNICIWGGFCHTTCPLEETLTGKNLSLWISTTETVGHFKSQWKKKRTNLVYNIGSQLRKYSTIRNPNRWHM